MGARAKKPRPTWSMTTHLIPKPLPVLLDAADLFAIVVWHRVLDRLARWVDPVALDVLVKVVVLVGDLLCVLTVQQAPDRCADGGTREPAETRTCERETGVDVNGVDTGDGVAGVDFEGEEVGAGGGTGEKGGGDGGDHARETARSAQLEVLVPAEMVDIAARWRGRGSGVGAR